MATDDTVESITLHSSWRGLLTSLLGSSVVLGLGLLALAANGTSPVGVVVAALGALLVLGVLADYPVASTFDVEGVTRRAVIRRHRIAWSSVRQLTRTRPSLLALRKKAVEGGLTAVVGRRRYLLTDVAESADEHDRLVDLLDDVGLGLDTLRRPAEDVPPTWLYRRRSWRPDGS